MNPRSDRVETPDEIVAAVARVLRQLPPRAVFLNPDCGFGTFSARPVATAETAFLKLRAVADAARELRRAHAAA